MTKSSRLHHLGLFCHYLRIIFKYICKNKKTTAYRCDRKIIFITN